MTRRRLCYFRGKNPLDDDVAAVAVKRAGGEDEVFTTLSGSRVRDRPDEQFPPDVQVYMRPVAVKLFEFRERENAD
ncbi:MAG: hypothetical protein GF416_06710 [Candidatus Altiarchaeales archaeon]|nr:hypothetical protein [Candidatus Altiarchaeales archaeon]MBD3416804.1 hypothetical protein [Candidatus Altiarchaeales archaeon]